MGDAPSLPPQSPQPSEEPTRDGGAVAPRSPVLSADRLIAQARQGHPGAIAALASRALASDRVTVHARRDDQHRLMLRFQGATAPPQDRVLAFARRLLDRLELTAIEPQVAVQGAMLGELAPEWETVLWVATSPPPPGAPAIAPAPNHPTHPSTTSQTPPPTHLPPPAADAGAIIRRPEPPSPAPGVTLPRLNYADLQKVVDQVADAAVQPTPLAELAPTADPTLPAIPSPEVVRQTVSQAFDLIEASIQQVQSRQLPVPSVALGTRLALGGVEIDIRLEVPTTPGPPQVVGFATRSEAGRAIAAPRTPPGSPPGTGMTPTGDRIAPDRTPGRSPGSPTSPPSAPVPTSATYPPPAPQPHAETYLHSASHRIAPRPPQPDADLDTPLSTDLDADLDTLLNTDLDADLDTYPSPPLSTDLDTDLDADLDADLDTPLSTDLDADLDADLDTYPSNDLGNDSPAPATIAPPDPHPFTTPPVLPPPEDPLLNPDQRDRAEALAAVAADPQLSLGNDPDVVAGRELYHQGRINEAIVRLNQAIDRNPRNAEAYRILAAAFGRQNQSAEAMLSLKIARDLYAQQQQPAIVAEIEEHFAASGLDPDGPGFHSVIGVVLYNQGNVDGAIGELNRAIAKDPHNPEPHKILGGILGKRGQTDTAIAYLRKAQDLYRAQGQAAAAEELEAFLTDPDDDPPSPTP